MTSSGISSFSQKDSIEDSSHISDEDETSFEGLLNSSVNIKSETSIKSLDNINNFSPSQEQINNEISDSNKNIQSNISIQDDLNENDKIAVNEIQSSIFSHIARISEFLANADEIYPNKKSDPCLQMLSDFFEVFNEQFKINFKLRNKLNEERKSNPINPKVVEEKRKEINKFLEEFKGIISSSQKDYSSLIDLENIEKSFNNIISIIQIGIKKTAKLKKLYKEIENKKREIANISNELSINEKKLENAKNNNENKSNILQKQIDQIQSQVSKMKAQIDDISPSVSSLKAKIQNEEKMRNDLSEIIEKRKNQLEIARQSFLTEENKQKKKQQKLGIRLSKLKNERRQLLINQQPLISALEEAEAQLKEVRNNANSQLESISNEKTEVEEKLAKLKLNMEEVIKNKNEKILALQKKEDECNECSVKLNEVNESLSVLKNKISQIEKYKQKIKNKILKNSEDDKNSINLDQDSNQTNDSNSNNYNENSNSQNDNLNFNPKTHELDDFIKKSISDEIQNLKKTKTEYKNQIEVARKENSIIRSKIRVKQEKIAQLNENQELKKIVAVKRKEVDKLESDANAQKKRYMIYQSTMKEYERMRDALGFPSSMPPSEVANHTVSMIRSWKQTEYDEEKGKELNEKITCKSIYEEFEYLFDEINDVESKLFGANP